MNMLLIKKIQRFFDKDILAFRSNALWRILDLLMSISTREACSQKIRSDVDRILAAETILKKTIYLIVTTCKVGAVVMGYFVFGPDFQMKSHNSSSGALWSIRHRITLKRMAQDFRRCFDQILREIRSPLPPGFSLITLSMVRFEGVVQMGLRVPPFNLRPGFQNLSLVSHQRALYSPQLTSLVLLDFHNTFGCRKSNDLKLKKQGSRSVSGGCV